MIKLAEGVRGIGIQMVDDETRWVTLTARDIDTITVEVAGEPEWDRITWTDGMLIAALGDNAFGGEIKFTHYQDGVLIAIPGRYEAMVAVDKEQAMFLVGKLINWLRDQDD